MAMAVFVQTINNYVIGADKFLGDQRSSYNHDLTFKLSIGENSPEPNVYDVILESGSGLRITQAIFGQGNPIPSDTVSTLFLSPNGLRQIVTGPMLRN